VIFCDYAVALEADEVHRRILLHVEDDWSLCSAGKLWTLSQKQHQQ